MGPSRSIAALRSDLASRFAVSYEYRRYLWRDVLFDGLDVGAGAQGIATRVGFDRHITQDLATKARITGGGFAGVVSIGLHRFERLRVDASWANGAVVSVRSAQHSTQSEAETYGGGNWLTNAVVSGRVARHRDDPAGGRLAAGVRRLFVGPLFIRRSSARHRTGRELCALAPGPQEP